MSLDHPKIIVAHETKSTVPNFPGSTKIHVASAMSAREKPHEGSGKLVARMTSEMKITMDSGNSQRLFQLIYNTEGRRFVVSETVSNKYKQSIHNKEQRLDRWAEYFRVQRGWSSTIMTTPAAPWAVSCEPPTARIAILYSNTKEAAELDELSLIIFKMGGGSLMNACYYVIARHLVRRAHAVNLG